MISLCINCETRPIENQETGLCATCAHMFRKAERQSKQVKIVSAPRKVSAKRSSQEREYYKLRDSYLVAYPVCEVVECHRKSSQIHHMKGRTNELLLDVNYFLAVCDICHQRITVDSAWAISQGYSILRSTKVKRNVKNDRV